MIIDMNNDLPAGWRRGVSNTAYDSLLKIYKTRDAGITYDYFDRIAKTILDSDFRSSTFITMSNDALTITLNDLGGANTLEELVAFARTLDSLLEI